MARALTTKQPHRDDFDPWGQCCVEGGGAEEIQDAQRKSRFEQRRMESTVASLPLEGASELYMPCLDVGMPCLDVSCAAVSEGLAMQL